jgi:hypothetical protein
MREGLGERSSVVFSFTVVITDKELQQVALGQEYNLVKSGLEH